MGTFTRIRNRLFGTPKLHPLDGILADLTALDAEERSRGEAPEARLIPQHALKQRVIIDAYMKDFATFLAPIDDLYWTEAEKNKRIAEMKGDFAKHIYRTKRLGWPELDKIIAVMKETRTDFDELEYEARTSQRIYKTVDPL